MRSLGAHRYVTPPPLYAHQEHGINELCKLTDPGVGRLAPGAFMLADEQGAGKTRQVIEAACRLYEEGSIDRVIIVAPASVCPVWFDTELGQLIEYLYVPATGDLYRPVPARWTTNNPLLHGRKMRVLVTNYEYVRMASHRTALEAVLGPKDLLILDESSAVMTHSSHQTRACYALRQKCGRVWLLNGTPVAENPGNLYAQFRIMDSNILGCKNWFAFRARYAILGGFKGKQIVSWCNLEDLTARTAPYILRRLKVDCLDLPPKLPPVAEEVTLKPATWSIYQDMLKDSLVYLDAYEGAGVSVAPQAITRIMRLAQITSGFVGGVMEREDQVDPETREVGREKLEWLLAWLDSRLQEDPAFKVLIWSRFRPEVFRAVEAIRAKFPGLTTVPLVGSQSRDDRQAALRLLHPTTSPPGAPAAIVGIARTGAVGLNFAAASNVVYLSQEHSLFVRSQSEERVHRPGQVNPVSYTDCLATGPKGQRTVDHAIARALKRKADTALWTCGRWAAELREGDE